MATTTVDSTDDLPQPTAVECRSSVWLYLSTFFGWLLPFGQLVAPACIWLSKRRESAFVDHHGKEVIRFQLIVTLIVYPIAALMSVDGDFAEVLALPLFVMAVAELVLLARGALAANRGAWYRFPIPTA